MQVLSLWLKGQTSAVYLAEPNQPFLRAISAIGAEAEEIKNDPIQPGIGILGHIALQKFGEIVKPHHGRSALITIKGTNVDPYEHLMSVPVLSKDQLTVWW